MKNIATIALAACFVVAAVHDRSPQPAAPAPESKQHCAVAADDEAIRNVAEAWRRGYNSGDSERVAQLYESDGYYLTQHFISGVVPGREKIRAYVQRGVDAGYKIDSIQILSTGCSSDLAYAVGSYESTNAGRKAFGVNLVVLRKTAGKWLIVAHESAVPDPETAIKSLDVQPAVPEKSREK